LGPDRPRGFLARILSTAGTSDELTILSGTGLNVLGLAVFVAATFATNVLISRAFGREGAAVLGEVTLVTQFAFVVAAATKFGMDVAAVRQVAVDVGGGRAGRARTVVARAAVVAATASLVGGLLVLLVSGSLARTFLSDGQSASLFRAAALAVPFIAVCQVFLGGTRGLKVMRHTLLVFWAGQPVSWMLLMLAAWAVWKSAGGTVLAYALSWIVATGAAWVAWSHETRGLPYLPMEAGGSRELLRYGAPRAPAALLSQLLFWADYFVASLYLPSDELGVYAAALRVAQTLMLFLVAVNYIFSPFVADLHARGERDRLDAMYKTLTRWMLAATLPLLLLLLIAPGAVLRVFGSTFDSGVPALRILLVGQLVNVGVGSVGFILIMVGRTGWDLAVYAGTFALDVGVAFVLAPRFGAEGAAIAQAAAMVVSNVARLYLVWRFVHIQPFTGRFARLAIPSVAAAAAMVPAHLLVEGEGWVLDLVVTGVIGLAVFVAVLYLSALTAGERRAIEQLVGRKAP
jgi:O-antigen/teichoic acid export membrane protein